MVAMTDGTQSHFLDAMGRGSILGLNNIIKGNEWAFNAISCSSKSTQVYCVSRKLIIKHSEQNSYFKENLETYQIELE